MGLSFGIRLVIILPTILFIIGFVFKAIIEKESIARIVKEYQPMSTETIKKLWKDFAATLIIDSFLLVMANGFIIRHELESNYLGEIALIAGAVFIMVFIFSLIYNSKTSFIVGVYCLFGLMGGELAYFSLYDTNILNFNPYGFIIIIIIALVCASVVCKILVNSYPTELMAKKNP